MNFFKKNNGTISLFLAIIMLATFTLTAIFVDGSRIRSATALVQGASDSAAASLIANYDKELKEAYGLFALDATSAEELQDDYFDFALANMSGYYPETDTVQQFFDRIGELSGIMQGRSEPLDLYGFLVDDVQVNPLYSIAEPDILENQVAEFSKYRAAVTALDQFDFITGSSEQLEKVEKDMELMADSMPLRKDLGDLFQAFHAFCEDAKVLEGYFSVPRSTELLVSEIESGFDDLNELAEEIKTLLEELDAVQEQEAETPEEQEAKAEQIEDLEEEIEEKEEDYTRTLTKCRDNKNTINQQITSARVALNQLRSTYSSLQSRASTLKGRLESYVQEANAKDYDSEAKTGLIDDANENIGRCSNIIANTYINNWFQDAESRITQMQSHYTDANSEFGYIPSSGEAASEYSMLEQKENNVLNKLRAIENSNEFGQTNNFEKGEPSSNLPEQDLNKIDQVYTVNKDQDETPIEQVVADATETIDNVDTLPSKSTSLQTGDAFLQEDLDFVTRVVDSYVASSLPITSANPETTQDYNLEDLGSLNFKSSGGFEKQQDNFNILSSFFSTLAEMTNGATKSILADTYAMNMFRTRLTRTDDYWINHNFEDRFHENYWVDRSTEDNLKFVNKRDLETKLFSEVEYILEGDPSDQTNNRNIYMKLFAMRIAINLAAFYGDAKLRMAVNEISVAAGYFAPLVQIGIMLALSSVETKMEMDFLVNEGLKIPLFKKSDITGANTNANMNISLQSLASGSLGQRYPKYKSDGSDFCMSYENFLQFFLVFQNRDKKLLRMADIIQINMQKNRGDPSYMLEDHKTYIRCKSEVSMKYLFMSYDFIREDLRKDGRHTIETLNYHGY